MPSSRRSFPFQTTILVLISGLVLATGLAIGGISLMSARTSASRLGRDIMREVARETVQEARRFLGAPRPVLQYLREHRPDQTPQARLGRFVALLHAWPEFDQVYYGDAEGAFTVARREGGGIIVERRWFEGATHRRLMDAVAPDGSWHLAPAPPMDYDPRQRPWYQAATSARDYAWTTPYLFAASGEPGMTAALPVYDRTGTLEGVFGVDLRLGELSRFMRHLPEHHVGRVYILDGGAVLAEPDPVDYVAGAGTLATLPQASHSRDAWLRAAAATPATSDTLRIDGETYLEQDLPFEVGGDLKLTAVVVVPQSDVLADFPRQMAATVGICVLALLAAFVLGSFLSARMARPLHRFADDMQQVGQFRLDMPPAPRSRIAEVDVMGQELERMKAGLRSFERYMPSDLVRMLIRNNQEARLGGVTARLTLFFADIRGFTTISEKYPPRTLVEGLAVYLDQMESVVRSHDGIVDKYIGDAVMAFWNAPIHPVEAMERLAIEAALDYLRLDRARQDESPRFEACIGIHTGDALVGNVGSAQRLSYTALGDTVNVASRLEGLNRMYGTRILVSGATLEPVQGLFECRPIDSVAVKGRSQPLQIHEVLARRGELTPPWEQALPLYRQALDTYRMMRFQEALDAFLAVLAVVPEDGPSRLFVERCREYLAAPPPSDWNGVYVAHSK